MSQTEIALALIGVAVLLGAATGGAIGWYLFVRDRWDLTLWQQLVLSARRVPSFYAGRLYEWVRDAHRPHYIEIDRAVCKTHGWRKSVAWPCQDWIEADARLQRARDRRP